MRYPVTITRDDNDTFLVTFPDAPGAVTYGDTVEDALARAPDALATVFDALIKDRRDIPPPSRVTRHSVEVPALVTAKVCLYDTMRTAKVGKAELARRLHWHLPQVDRVLNVRHSSQLDQIESAFAALGKRLTIDVADVPPRERQVVPGAVLERATRGRAAIRRGGTKKR